MPYAVFPQQTVAATPTVTYNGVVYANQAAADAAKLRDQQQAAVQPSTTQPATYTAPASTQVQQPTLAVAPTQNAVAPSTTTEVAASPYALTGTAPQTADYGGAETRQLGYDQVTGKYLYADSNPYLATAIDAALKPIQQQFMQQTLPGLTSQAVMSGAYGGARDGLLAQQATNDFTQNSMDTAGKIAYQNYMTERQLQQTAPQLLSQGLAIQEAPAQIAQALATSQDQSLQAQLDALYQQYTDSINAPWNGLTQLNGLLTGNGYSSTTGTTKAASGSALGNGITGALGGAATGAAIGSVVPGVGTALGAGVGGLAGLAGGIF